MKMNVTRVSLRLLASLLICASVLGASASAQSSQDTTRQTGPATVNEQLVIALEKMQVELEHLRRRDKLRDEEVAAYKKQVAAYDGLIKTLEAIIAKQRQIITETDSRTALSEQVVSEFKAQVADYKSELDRVTRSRNFWRRLAGLGATGALVVGVVIGLIAGNR